MQKSIAIVFDFDDTLAPDTTSGLIQSLGVDPDRFWAKDVASMIDDGWDPAAAYMCSLITLSRGNPARRITRERLAAWGRKVKPYAGVSQMFDRIRRHVRSIEPSAEVEFYGISSGLGEVLANTCIAAQFKRMWTSNFSYGPDGAIEFPKNIISFTDKTRFLYMTSKGFVSEKDPFAVNRKVPFSRIRIPFENMVYVGDGYTDVPCFSLMRANGGVAIGVFDGHRAGKWMKAWSYVQDGRVSNLVPADYRRNSALMLSLFMAVESIARRIQANAMLEPDAMRRAGLSVTRPGKK